MRTLSLLILAMATRAWAMDCPTGFEAFKSTVHAKVRRDCALCHDGNKAVAPPFAVVDAFNSYSQLVSYMNFSTIEESLLVIRAGNGHCNRVNCQEASGREMAELAAKWWEGGEKTCERNGRLFTPSLALPANLPGKDQGFMTLNFDLGKIKPELNGIRFQIDVQNYLDTSSFGKGVYRFRSPRMVGGEKSVYAKDIKILLNGKYDVIYNAYSTIDGAIPFFAVEDSVRTATPVLSAHGILMLKDSLPNPKISVSFVEVNVGQDDGKCKNREGFKNQVMPLLTANKCMSCHDGKRKSLGEKVFSGGDAQSLCERVSALMHPLHLQLSPMIVVPSQGLNGHPQLTATEQTQFMEAFRKWLKQN